MLVGVSQAGGGKLSCCGEEMSLLKPNTTDAAGEKHVPVVVDKGDFIEVNIGSVEHPMTPEHHILFIIVVTADKVYKAELKPGDKPSATFPIKLSEVIEVREFCNLHMLWKA